MVPFSHSPFSSFCPSARAILVLLFKVNNRVVGGIAHTRPEMAYNDAYCLTPEVPQPSLAKHIT